MAVNWKPVFTTAGLQAMQAAHGQGLSVKISHVAIGSAVYPVRNNGFPTDEARAMTALKMEQIRVPVGPLSTVSEFQVAVQAEIEGGDPAFWINEVGFVTDTGVLLAVWSDENGLGFRNPEVPWVFKFVLSWSDLPGHMITVVMPEGDAAVTALSTDLERLRGKVRHTVEVGGGLDWSDVDNSQLTTAIGTMMDNRVDVAVAVLDAEIAALRAIKPVYDIPFVAGFGWNMGGEDIAVQTWGVSILSRNVTVEDIVGHLGVAATGADLIIDILVNGVSIFTVKPKFAGGSNVLTPGMLDAARVALTAGDRLDFAVTQVGSVVRGQKLRIGVKCRER